MGTIYLDELNEAVKSLPNPVFAVQAGKLTYRVMLRPSLPMVMIPVGPPLLPERREVEFEAVRMAEGGYRWRVKSEVLIR